MLFMVHPEYRPKRPNSQFVARLYGFKLHPMAYQLQQVCLSDTLLIYSVLQYANHVFEMIWDEMSALIFGTVKFLVPVQKSSQKGD